jgi:hypothetical protein
MNYLIDQSGNVHVNNLYIGESNVAIDSSCNFYGETANFKKIKINNKKFIDSLRNITASNVTCGCIDTSDIKINGKLFVDKNRNLIVNSVRCNEYNANIIQCNELIIDSSGATITGDVTCNNVHCDNVHCDNLYLPIGDSNIVGRVLCSTVNTNNIIIPTDSNCYFANMNFSMVLNGSDGTITGTKLYSLNGFDTSGNINMFGNTLTCGKVNANKFIFPTIESDYTLNASDLLPTIDLTEGETYYDKYDGKLYVFIGNKSWNIFIPSATLTLP